MTATRLNEETESHFCHGRRPGMPGRGMRGLLALTLLAGGVAGSACASSGPPDGEIDLSNDMVADELEDEVIGGDDQLNGDDYLVQVEKGEFRVADFTGGGRATGMAGFRIGGGEEFRASTYYLTSKATSGGISPGKIACFFTDKEVDDIFQPPASKEEARAGRWRCRVIRDVSNASWYLVGDDQVAKDNIRVERSKADEL